MINATINIVVYLGRRTTGNTGQVYTRRNGKTDLLPEDSGTRVTMQINGRSFTFVQVRDYDLDKGATLVALRLLNEENSEGLGVSLEQSVEWVKV